MEKALKITDFIDVVYHHRALCDTFTKIINLSKQADDNAALEVQRAFLHQIHRLLTALHENLNISAEELAENLTEMVVLFEAEQTRYISSQADGTTVMYGSSSPSAESEDAYRDTWDADAKDDTKHDNDKKLDSWDVEDVNGDQHSTPDEDAEPLAPEWDDGNDGRAWYAGEDDTLSPPLPGEYKDTAQEDPEKSDMEMLHESILDILDQGAQKAKPSDVRHTRLGLEQVPPMISEQERDEESPQLEEDR